MSLIPENIWDFKDLLVIISVWAPTITQIEFSWGMKYGEEFYGNPLSRFVFGKKLDG